jgi:ABC-type sugar transport system ATPase subunit
MGAGRTSAVKGIFGDLYLRSGSIEKDGKKISIRSPQDAIKHGIAYVPNERKLEGLMLMHSVNSNISISIIKSLMKKMKIDRKREKEIADKWIQNLNIKTPSANTIVESLSGGNQQKVVISRWLETKPDVLILNDPTRGIDVGAKAEIYSLMEKLCEEGIGIIMISSDLKEIISMADRIVVMSEGKVTGEVPREEISQESLMRLAVGGI